MRRLIIASCLFLTLLTGCAEQRQEINSETGDTVDSRQKTDTPTEPVIDAVTESEQEVVQTEDRQEEIQPIAEPEHTIADDIAHDETLYRYIIEGELIAEANNATITAEYMERQGLEVRIMMKVENKMDTAIRVHPMENGIFVNNINIGGDGMIEAGPNSTASGVFLISYTDIILAEITQIDSVYVSLLGYETITNDNVVCCSAIQFKVMEEE